MKNNSRIKWLLSCFFMLFAFGVYGQRTCKTKSRCRSGPVNQSSSVFIQITDETHGKVVTYEKEFKLDHIPVAQREQYVDNLIDELTGFSDDQDSFFIKSNKKTAPPRTTAQRRRY